jgi:hypothetical protein
MLNVLITVDTEVYPLLPDWRADNLARDVRRDIYGETPGGDYGLRYQIEVLNRFGLKAVFFVEGLFASAVGPDPLRRMVREVEGGGHEVQLHLHPEWLAWMPDPPAKPDGRWATNQFDRAEQTRMIALGLRNLRAAGAGTVTAFRAGDYAANADTLHALRDNDVTYDTSANPCYPNSFPDVPALRDATQPKLASGVCEIPVSHWNTPPVGRRHAQFTNSTAGELRAALRHAEQNGWHSFVIVSHSFELLKRRRQRVERPAPDPVVVSRFEALCRFLGDHRDRFRTCGFADLGAPPDRDLPEKPPLSSPIYRTAYRYLQQAYRRLT